MVHTNTLCGQNAENLYIETGGTLDIKGLSYSLILKIEVIFPSETFADFYRTTWRYTPPPKQELLVINQNYTHFLSLCSYFHICFLVYTIQRLFPNCILNSEVLKSVKRVGEWSYTLRTMESHTLCRQHLGKKSPCKLSMIFCLFVSSSVVTLSPLGTAVTVWPIVPAPGDR
jgi:hypothetical protein